MNLSGWMCDMVKNILSFYFLLFFICSFSVHSKEGIIYKLHYTLHLQFLSHLYQTYRDKIQTKERYINIYIWCFPTTFLWYIQMLHLMLGNSFFNCFLQFSRLKFSMTKMGIGKCKILLRSIQIYLCGTYIYRYTYT